MPRIGILGGAFNPPHIGHVICAQEALVQLGLDKVVFVPVGTAPHRELRPDPGADVRAELTELAIKDDDRFAVSRIELDRDGPSYTVDTLRALREESPADELFLILGGDQAAALGRWHEPEEVLSLATLAVVERASWSRNAIGIRIGGLRGHRDVRYLEMPAIQISSSLIRRRAAAGLPIRYLVPDRVGDAIAARRLYATPEDAAAPGTSAAPAGSGDSATPGPARPAPAANR